MSPTTKESHVTDILYKAYMGKTIICRILTMSIVIIVLCLCMVTTCICTVFIRIKAGLKYAQGLKYMPGSAAE